MVEVDGTGLKVGPTSTVIGAALLNAVFVEATCTLAAAGWSLPSTAAATCRVPQSTIGGL